MFDFVRFFGIKKDIRENFIFFKYFQRKLSLKNKWPPIDLKTILFFFFVCTSEVFTENHFISNETGIVQQNHTFSIEAKKKQTSKMIERHPVRRNIPFSLREPCENKVSIWFFHLRMDSRWFHFHTAWHWFIFKCLFGQWHIVSHFEGKEDNNTTTTKREERRQASNYRIEWACARHCIKLELIVALPSHALKTHNSWWKSFVIFTADSKYKEAEVPN